MFIVDIILIVLALLCVMHYFYVLLFYFSNSGKAQKTEPGWHLFKVNNGNTKTMYEIYSKLTIMIPRSGVFIINFDVSIVECEQVHSALETRSRGIFKCH